eukprot:357815-Chlamydomonas_euryale.AAC.1
MDEAMRAMAAAGGIADAGRSASLEQRLAALEARLAAGGGGGERPGGDVAAVRVRAWQGRRLGWWCVG